MLQSHTDVHVLNVGRGSCTVIQSPSGRATMIDINDGGELRPDEYEAIKKRSSLTMFAEAQIKKEEQLLDDPIDWFKAHVGTSMWRFILSHPDMDHLSGIRRLFNGSSGIDLTVAWAYDHKRVRKEEDFPTEAAWLDWLWYTAFRHEIAVDGVTWPHASSRSGARRRTTGRPTASRSSLQQSLWSLDATSVTSTTTRRMCSLSSTARRPGFLPPAMPRTRRGTT
jgi:hypothetical protein